MRVSIDHSFFKKERNQAYSDWQLSIWRELFQNSVDQGASEIRITLTQNDTLVRLTFHDNGPGMTRDVLERVYFAIGATTKTGPDQIGGMGRARVLTCFSMPSYQIRSDDYLVVGHGGEYQIQNMPKLDATCLLIIDIDDTTLDQLHYKLKCFLEETHIDARVFVNSQPCTFRAPHLGRHSRDLIADGEIFARVYINKSVPTQRVILRVLGLSMFTTNTSAPAQIVVELLPAKARVALTSNRDGLRGNYRAALNNFLRELAVDVQSSLHARFTNRTTVKRGGGLKAIHKKRTIKPMVYDASEGFRSAPETTQSAPRAALTEHTVVEHQAQVDHFGVWLARTFGDIFIYDEIEDNPAMHKAVANYLPENWQPMTLASGKTMRKGGNIAKVLLMWQTAINYVLEVSMDILELESVSYGVGFLFAQENQAEKRTTTNDGHVFVLRPIDKAGKLAYSVRERGSLKRLMTHAKHEVAHISERWHSEAFSNVREAIDQVVDEAECFRRMKAALDAVPDFDTMVEKRALAA